MQRTHSEGIATRPLNPAQSIALGFLLLILLGTALLASPWASPSGKECSLVDAFFTSTSAVCVTGLIVKSTSGDFNLFGQIVILVLIQIGGLGYMTLTTFASLLFGRRVSLRDRLILRDSLNIFNLEDVGHFTGRIIKVTLALEAAGAAVLTLAWAREYGLQRGAYLAVFHSVSAFNNAGFSLFDTSLIRYVSNPFVVGTVTGLFVMGGLGFLVISELELRYRRLVPRLSLHSRIVLTSTAALLGGGTVAVLALEYSNPGTLGPLGFAGKLQAAVFQAATPRTAGFNSVDIASMMPGTMMLVLLLMIIGASPGGTGGGVKTTTVAAIAASMLAVMRGEQDVRFGHRRLARENVNRATFIFMGAGCYVLLATFALVLFEEKKIFGMWFEVVSAFGTVGLSVGDGGVLSLSSLMGAPGKLIIVATMFVGRVGLMTAGIALLKRREEALVRLPAERIIIG